LNDGRKSDGEAWPSRSKHRMRLLTPVYKYSSHCVYLCSGQTLDGPQPPLPRARGSMEHVRARDNDSCPHPTENPAAPLIQPDPSLLTPNGNDEYETLPSPPPSATNSQHANRPWFLRLKPRRPKPLFRGFEAPRFPYIAILTVLCLITYPAFHLLTLVARDESLFVVRIIVSLWCSAIGFALGYILLKIGARHLEAASEFTLAGRQGFLRLYFKQPGPP